MKKYSIVIRSQEYTDFSTKYRFECLEDDNFFKLADELEVIISDMFGEEEHDYKLKYFKKWFICHQIKNNRMPRSIDDKTV